MKKIIQILIITLITVVNGYGQSFVKIGQNEDYSPDTTINYVYSYAPSLQIDVSLPILTISEEPVSSGVTYGYNTSTSIPSNWGFEVLDAPDSNYTISGQTITYTGSTTNITLNVKIRVFDSSTNIDINGLDEVVVNYRITSDNFTVATNSYNSCQGSQFIVVNEHTENGLVLSNPYTIHVYLNDVLQDNYPKTQDSNEFVIDDLDPNLTNENYTFSITNILGQVVTGVFTIYDPYMPEAIVNFAGFECHDSITGDISIRIEGGAAPISWELSDGTTSITSDDSTGGNFQTVNLDVIISDLSQATYTFTFEDSNGCGDTITIPVLKPSEIELDAVIINNVTCPGGSDGSLEFTVSGGWAEPFSGNIFNPSPPDIWGDYTFTLIKDGANQTGTPIQYSVGNPQNGIGVYFSGLSAGTYALLVSEIVTTTFNGAEIIFSCEVLFDPFDPFELTEPPAFDITETLTNVSCNALSDGAIEITASGGTPFTSPDPAYLYVWVASNGGDVSGQETAEDLTGLVAGTYTVTITDAVGCEYEEVYTITEPDALIVSFNDSNNISCFGGADGCISVEVTGGTEAYIFTINGQPVATPIPTGTGGTIYELCNLSADEYTIVVTDQNNCTANQTITQTLTEPTELIVTSSGEALLCNGNTDGNITGSISGGTAPYTITLDGSAVQFTGITDGGSFDFSGLAAGTYTFTITDANVGNGTGCTTTITEEITEPNELVLSTVTDFTLDCYADTDGILTGTVSGGTAGYTVSLSGGTIPITATETVAADGGVFTFSGLLEGTYTITIEDANASTGGSGCATSQTGIVISQPDELIQQFESQTNVSCNGGEDGLFTISVSGGNPAYIFSLNGTPTAPTEISVSGNTHYEFSGLSAGAYTVNVTDQNSCLSTDLVVTLTEPSPISYTIDTIIGLDCNADTDGVLSGTISGGTAPYTISIDDTSTSLTVSTDGGTFSFTGLSAGDYQLTIVDGNYNTTLNASDYAGCIVAIPILTITEPSELLFSGITGDVLDCYGDSNGEISGGILGGTAPYTVTIDGTSTSIVVSADGGTFTFSGLVEGTYNLTVTDANYSTGGGGCATSQTNIIVSQPDELIQQFESLTNVSCNGGEDGLFTISVSGGNPAYIFSLNGTPTAPTEITVSGNTHYEFSGLSSGAYTVNVTDQNSCLSTDLVVTLTEPSPISYTIDSLIGLDCNADTDGTLSGTISGGTAPYTISIDGTSIGLIVSTDGGVFSFTGLIAGDYQLTISDSNYSTSLSASDYAGCTVAVSTLTITEPNELLFSNVTGDVLACYGDSNGEITGVISGGTAPYTVSIDGTAMSTTVSTDGGTFTFIGMLEDTYNLTVTDANTLTGGAGCTANETGIVISQPIAFNITESLTHVSCNGLSDGAIEITASGGTPFTSPDPAYTYAWVASNGGDVSGQETAEDLTGLIAGTYTVTITDANNCEHEEAYTITEPEALTINFNDSNNISCFGGTDGCISVEVTGGTTAYIFTINGQPVATPIPTGAGSTIYEFCNLPADEYTIVVTDQNNCTANQTITQTLTEPTELIATSSGEALLCNGNTDGNITGSISGGTAPYAITLDGSGIEFTGITDGGSFDFSGLAVGTYTFTITDANSGNGCTTILTEVITEPEALTVSHAGELLLCNGDNDGNITGTISGGTAPYTISLDGTTAFQAVTVDGGSFDFSGLEAGVYNFTIIDANSVSGSGCTTTITEEITSLNEVTLFSHTLSSFSSGTGNVINVSCIDANDGFIETSFTGGTNDFTYVWTTTDGVIPTGQNDQANISGLISGTYTITATDENNCAVTESFTLVSPRILDITATNTANNNCFGAAVGSILTQISTNGTVDGILYTYSISGTPSLPSTYPNTQTITGLSTSFENLPAGSYQITVSDENDCTEILDSIIVSEPTSVLTVSGEITQYGDFQISCNGANDGEIEITASGGGGITNNTAYVYTWTLDGAPYTLNDTSASTHLQDLEPGVYDVTVTDIVGCTTIESYTITEPPVLNLTGVLSDYSGFGVSGSGVSDGNINTTVSGGMSPYAYVWTTTDGTIPSGQETQEDLTGVSAGTYTVVVTDYNDCTITEDYVITEPESLNIIENILAHVDVNCFGGTTGVLEVTITQESVSPYDYILTNSASVIVSQVDNQTALSHTFSNLVADTYSIEVVDANGNSETLTGIVVSEPTSVLAVSGVITPYGDFQISCNGANDGEIEITALGGGGPTNDTTYVYTWILDGNPYTLNGASNDTHLQDLEPGEYEVMVTDAVGCTAIESYTITEPTALTLAGVLSDYNGFGVSGSGVSDGNIDITVSGGTSSYTYVWTTTDGTISAGQETQEDLTDLSAGTYMVVVTDSNNCTITEDFILTAPEVLEITEQLASHVDVDCFGDTTSVLEVTVTQESVSPYDYILTNSASVIVSQTDNQTTLSHTFSNLVADTYSIEVVDANGNSETLTGIVVSEPTAILAASGEVTQYGAFQISCNGANDGEIEITALGGGGPTNDTTYVYTWTLDGAPHTLNGTSTSIHLQDLEPGVYEVTVTDIVDCTAVESYTIEEPTALSLGGALSNYNGFGVSCSGTFDGNIDITILGGTSSYAYVWTTTDGTIPPGQETQEDLTGLSAGTYTIVVTDSNSCQIFDTYVITEPDAIVLNENISEHVDVDCFGDATGTFEVQVNPTVAPYTFTLTGTDYLLNAVSQLDTQTTLVKNYTGLLAGNYSISVTDANGCTANTLDVTITQPVTPISANEILLDYSGFGISCFGETDGSIQLSPTGGTPFISGAPYTVSWTGPNGFTATTTTISNLEAGTYTLMLTDAVNCVYTDSYEVTAPNEIVIVIDAEQDVFCNGDFDGNILITPTGGSGGYTFAWTKNGSPYAITEDVLAIGVGLYVVIVTDSNGCYKTETFTITEPDALEIVLDASTDILCFGDATGNIEVTTSGGTPLETSPGVFVYQYSWSGPNGFTATTEDISGLEAGVYNLIVTDNLGCTTPLQVIITQPDDLVISTTKTDVTCFGANDGTIVLDIQGGVSPYTIVWSNFGNGLFQSNLAPGIYNITVTDTNMCEEIVTVTILEAPLFDTNPIVTNITCFGEGDGMIDLQINGGVAPIIVTWADDPSAGEVRNNLSAGVYTVVLTDNSAANCEITETFIINEPSEIILTAVIDNAMDCIDVNSGAIDISIVGGTAPYTYLWNTGATTEDLQDVPQGNYTVTVTDVNGCFEIGGVYIVTRQSEIITDITTTITADCDLKTVNQTTTIAASGGVSPYTFMWSSGIVIGLNGETMTTDQNGTVIVNVMDALGCTTQVVFDVDLFEIGSPGFTFDSMSNTNCSTFSIEDPIFFTNIATGDFTVVSWDFGDNTGTIVNEENPSHIYSEPGTYVVTQTVEYPYGCVYTDTQIIEITEGYGLVLPNTFTPNNDGINDTIRPWFSCMDSVEMSIYDTWGALLYVESGVDLKGWDGFVSGNLAENGNYILVVKATTFYGKEINMNGPITLLK